VWRTALKALAQPCVSIIWQHGMERGAGVENASTLNGMADLSSAESGPVEGGGGAGCASDVVEENQSAALTSNSVPEK